jgi:hypothetical protein
MERHLETTHILQGLLDLKDAILTKLSSSLLQSNHWNKALKRAGFWYALSVYVQLLSGLESREYGRRDPAR